MFKKNKTAFTLVELIVVITILAILWTIAFISLQWYSKNSRDSVRITDVSTMESALEYYHIAIWKYPISDSYDTISYGWDDLWYQWVFGEGVLRNLSRNLSKIPLDPLTQAPYTYSVDHNKAEFQILSLMEWDNISINNRNQVSANWKINVTPKLDGNFNEVYVKTPNYIVPVPSIILAEDTTWWVVLDNVNIQSLVTHLWNNIPSNGSYIYSTGALTWLELSVWTGALNRKTDDIDKLDVINIIKSAYQWNSTLASKWPIKDILQSSTDEEWLTFFDALVFQEVRKRASNSTSISDQLISGVKISEARSLPIWTVIIYDGEVAPDGWMIADGTRLDITSYSDLYSVIGTTFGGDWRTNFAVPDFRGRTGLWVWQWLAMTNRFLGGIGGQENVALSIAQMPEHNHNFYALIETGGNWVCTDKYVSNWSIYHSSGLPNSSFGQESLSSVWWSLAHNNMMPFKTKTYIIKVQNDTVSSANYDTMSVSQWNEIVNAQLPQNGNTWFGWSIKPTNWFYAWGNCDNIESRAVIWSWNGAGLSSREYWSIWWVESVSLNILELPSHSHSINYYNGTSNTSVPFNSSNYTPYTFSESSSYAYWSASNLSVLNSWTIWFTWSWMAHENMMPYTVLECIKRSSGVSSLQKTPWDSISAEDWNSLSSKFLPVGSIVWYGWMTIPTWYLELNGSMLNISNYPDLYDVIWITYWWDGVNTFWLPDLRWRAPIGAGQWLGLSQRNLWEKAWFENVSLTTAQIPNHSHNFIWSLSPSTSNTPTWVLASSAIYQDLDGSIARSTMHENTVWSTWAGEAHENMMPFTTIRFLIKY